MCSDKKEDKKSSLSELEKLNLVSDKLVKYLLFILIYIGIICLVFYTDSTWRDKVLAIYLAFYSGRLSKE